MKLKTGIAGLDELLMGGLPPEILLITGEPGSGIEVFAQQVAYKRAQQTRISYLTLNKTVAHIRQEMSGFGWDTTKLEDSGSWRFISISAKQIEDTVEREMCQNRSIVIDSLSDTLYREEAFDAIKMLKNMSMQNMQIQELHFALLTKGMQDSKTETALQHFADGVIDFTITHGHEFATRKMFIKKLGGVVTPTRNIPYMINERGITIETAIRIT